MSPETSTYMEHINQVINKCKRRENEKGSGKIFVNITNNLVAPEETLQGTSEFLS